jgi:hypothetical protein
MAKKFLESLKTKKCELNLPTPRPQSSKIKIVKPKIV